ncbi:MAG TPA: DUF4013 domain-containing protein [Anaerolineales bacterium]|nr:DUF4013 domain-containing protein [Anaerolineales bacterium]
MAEPIDLSEAVRYPFRDARWPGKAVVLALVSFIPILNFASIGFEVETAGRVAAAEPLPMPEWGDLGGLFRRGLWLALARYLYALPLFLLMGVAAAAGFGLLATLNSRHEAWSTVFGLVCCSGFLLMVAFGFVFSFFSPAITVRYLQIGTFSSCFDLPAIWRNFRGHPTPHFAVFASILGFSLVLSLLAGPVTVLFGWIPCIGPIANWFVLAAMVSAVLLFSGHLEGQLLRIVTTPAAAKP